MEDCDVALIAVLVPRELIQDEMPPGWAPATQYPGVGLDVFRCESIHAGTRQLAPALLATVGVMAEAPADVRTDADAFVFEWLASTEELRDALSNLGINAVEAGVRFGPGLALPSAVTLWGEGLRYHVEAVPIDGASPGNATFRAHWVGGALDVESTWELVSNYPAPVQASGGALGRLAPAGGSASHGSAVGTGSMTLRPLNWASVSEEPTH